MNSSLKSLQREVQELRNLEESLFLKATLNRFSFHFPEIFAKGIAAVEGKFIHGHHFDEWCDFFQFNDWADAVGPRNHGKTTCFCHGYLGFRLWQSPIRPNPYYEIVLISKTEDLAANQISIFNRYIENNPYYEHFESLSDAEGVGHYKVKCLLPDHQKEWREFKVWPAGIDMATRSIHPNEVFLTDIHSDPNRKDVAIDPVEIIKEMRKVRRSIINLPKKGEGRFHSEGTRISKYDVHGYCQSSKLFAYQEWKAIINDAKKEILFPNMWTYEDLAARREDGPDDFNQEFQCVPLRGVKGYISQEALEQCIDADLVPFDFEEDQAQIKGEVRGGYDLGKKVHPSHIAIYEWDGKGKKIERLSYWMDQVDYSAQLEVVERIIENLHVDVLKWDNTRGEFESLYETGTLPAAMQPVVFNTKSKHSMARALGSAVRKREVVFLDDARQMHQILNCDGDLKSEETSEGHGDSFWSNAMAIESFTEPEPIAWAA